DAAGRQLAASGAPPPGGTYLCASGAGLRLERDPITPVRSEACFTCSPRAQGLRTRHNSPGFAEPHAAWMRQLRAPMAAPVNPRNLPPAAPAALQRRIVALACNVPRTVSAARAIANRNVSRFSRSHIRLDP